MINQNATSTHYLQRYPHFGGMRLGIIISQRNLSSSEPYYFSIRGVKSIGIGLWIVSEFGGLVISDFSWVLKFCFLLF